MSCYLGGPSNRSMSSVTGNLRLFRLLQVPQRCSGDSRMKACQPQSLPQAPLRFAAEVRTDTELSEFSATDYNRSPYAKLLALGLRSLLCIRAEERRLLLAPPTAILEAKISFFLLWALGLGLGSPWKAEIKA